MRAAVLTPMRLLSGIAALTILCMAAVALVADHMADIFLTSSNFAQPSRVHLIDEAGHAIQRADDFRAEYLKTGSPAELKNYQQASTQVDASMDRLIHEDYEVTARLAHAQDLRHEVDSKLSQIGQSMQTAAAPAGGATGDELGHIQKLLGSLAQEESHDVSDQIEATQARTRFHRDLVVALAVINVLFLAGIAFCAFQIRRLHSLVTMCAWSKQVQFQGRWVPLEEFLRKRFGVRVSHGISDAEYEKWATPDNTANTIAEKLREGSAIAPTPTVLL